MIESIVKDPVWKPTERLWYNKFNSAIVIGPFDDCKSAVLTDISEKCKNRWTWTFNPETKQYRIFSKIFTSDQVFLRGLMNTFNYTEVQTPMNNFHAETLEANTICIRKTPWYGKYRYKVYNYIPWNRKNEFTKEDGKQMKSFVEDNFSDKESRIRTTNYSYDYSDWRSLPYIYTNNEGAVMMFKMAFNDKVDITITEVMTLDEIKEKA